MSKLHFETERRLLAYGGIESGLTANSERSGNTKETLEHEKAKATVDALMRDPSRIRKNKTLYDRIEETKKSLASSHTSRASDILARLNTAHEGIITEQARWGQGRNAANPEHVQAYHKPWNDLFASLEEAGKLFNYPESDKKTDAMKEDIRTPEIKTSPETIARAKATVAKHLQTWNKDLFQDFNSETATGEVKAAYDHLVTAVMKWETNQSHDKAAYDSAWIRLKDAVKILKTTELGLDNVQERPKNFRESVEQNPEVMKLKNLVESTQPNLRWEAMLKQYLTILEYDNKTGKTRTSEEQAKAFDPKKLARYVDLQVQSFIISDGFIKVPSTRNTYTKRSVSGHYRNELRPLANKPLEIISFIGEHAKGNGGDIEDVDLKGLNDYLKGRADME